MAKILETINNLIFIFGLLSLNNIMASSVGPYGLFRNENGDTYITLTHEDNYSSYKLPTRKPWGVGDSDIITQWSKVRIDLKTCTLLTGDFTYAKSVGRVMHGTVNTDQVPYGTTFGCEAPNYADGEAKINLQGTGLTIADDQTWGFGGYMPAGSAVISPDRESVVIRGGGYCGWEAPSQALALGEQEIHRGGAFIKLAGCSPPSIFKNANGDTYLNLPNQDNIS